MTGTQRGLLACFFFFDVQCEISEMGEIPPAGVPVAIVHGTGRRGSPCLGIEGSLRALVGSALAVSGGGRLYLSLVFLFFDFFFCSPCAALTVLLMPAA